MGCRYKKLNLTDLASKEFGNHFRQPTSLYRRATNTKYLDKINLEMRGSEPRISTVFLDGSRSEPLPLYSEDERYMGDYIDGIYQCFELRDNVYVSHYNCETYYQLKNHMFFVHA